MSGSVLSERFLHFFCGIGLPVFGIGGKQIRRDSIDAAFHKKGTKFLPDAGLGTSKFDK
jgi:hypothetical protein